MGKEVLIQGNSAIAESAFALGANIILDIRLLRLQKLRNTMPRAITRMVLFMFRLKRKWQRLTW